MNMGCPVYRRMQYCNICIDSSNRSAAPKRLGNKKKTVNLFYKYAPEPVIQVRINRNEFQLVKMGINTKTMKR